MAHLDGALAFVEPHEHAGTGAGRELPDEAGSAACGPGPGVYSRPSPADERADDGIWAGLGGREDEVVYKVAHRLELSGLGLFLAANSA